MADFITFSGWEGGGEERGGERRGEERLRTWSRRIEAGQMTTNFKAVLSDNFSSLPKMQTSCFSVSKERSNIKSFWQ